MSDPFNTGNPRTAQLPSLFDNFDTTPEGDTITIAPEGAALPWRWEPRPDASIVALSGAPDAMPAIGRTDPKRYAEPPPRSLSAAAAERYTDWAQILRRVAMALLGSRLNREMSSSNELRFGSKGSLSVDVTPGRGGQWYDNEKAEGGGVFAFVMREVPGIPDEPAARRWLENQGYLEKPDKPQTREIFADFEDEDGRILAREVRRENAITKKRVASFFKRPDGDGGFVGGKGAMSGVRRVLYRLPAICRLPLGTRIFITEGWKKTEALTGPGWRLEATNAPFGGGKWRKEYSDFLRGMEVVILPDNDPTGEADLEKTAASLAMYAATVKVVRLPGLGPKEDLIEWIDRGGTPEQLDELADVAPTRGPAAEDSERDFLDDFYAYLPANKDIYVPTMALWPAEALDARYGKGSHKLLAQKKPVEQMTWAPGLPMIIENKLAIDGSWIEKQGARCFNTYRSPTMELGDPAKAGLWVEHIRRLYPDDTDHIVRWLAHRKQRPGEKINHCLVLGGNPGVGKDSILEPAKRAIGSWNFQEASPIEVLGRFNGFVKAVILRINESHDLGDVDRYSFYEHTKVLCAAPPDVIRVDEKYTGAHMIVNCCGVVVTTNYQNALYLPSDDRRSYVTWSECKQEDFEEGYFDRLWAFFNDGGDRHVAAYLATLDISGFKAKEPPRKTPAFWVAVNAERSTDEENLENALDRLGRPQALILPDLVADNAGTDFARWLTEPKNQRTIPFRMKSNGYDVVPNPDAKNGRWRINLSGGGSEKRIIYALSELSVRDRLTAAKARASGESGKTYTQQEAPF